MNHKKFITKSICSLLLISSFTITNCFPKVSANPSISNNIQVIPNSHGISDKIDSGSTQDYKRYIYNNRIEFTSFNKEGLNSLIKELKLYSLQETNVFEEIIAKISEYTPITSTLYWIYKKVTADIPKSFFAKAAIEAEYYFRKNIYVITIKINKNGYSVKEGLN